MSTFLFENSCRHLHEISTSISAVLISFHGLSPVICASAKAGLILLAHGPAIGLQWPYWCRVKSSRDETLGLGLGYEIWRRQDCSSTGTLRGGTKYTGRSFAF